MYEMKDEYLTGIEFIDKEHAKLFSIADQAYEVLMDDMIPDKYDYIVHILDELKSYTQYHFNHEEDYMEKMGYKRFLSQKVDHKEFIDRLMEFNLEHVDANQKDAILQILDFLNSWLVDHIVKKDKLIGE